MSEHLFRFLVGELKTLRIVCKRERCGAVTELSIAALAEKEDAIKCPGCGEPLQRALNPYLQDLAKALSKFPTKEIDVELSLPVNDDVAQRGRK